jgi:hypothetical protein
MTYTNCDTRLSSAATGDPDPLPRGDRLLQIGTTLTVAALAIVAAVISFDHMQQLALMCSSGLTHPP